MKNVNKMVLMLCLVLSGAFSYAQRRDVLHPNTGSYVITFTLPNGDQYYGEFEVTD